MHTLDKLFDLNFTTKPEFIIFTEFCNNRLIYTIDFLIKRKWKKNYIITHDEQSFLNSDKIKLNYSTKYFQNTINIFPTGLLQQKNIVNNYVPSFSVNLNGYYSQDIFDNIFFCISRYEEWQPSIHYDKHQRFEASQTLFQELLPRPYLDIAIHEFEKYILQHYPSFQFPYKYQEIYTFDLDNILAFKGKNLYRTLGALVKLLLRREVNLFKERINVLVFQKDDPFKNVYDFIKDISNEKPVIFFILSRSSTVYDRAAEINHPDTVEILSYLKSFSIIGLHPSYYSFDNEQLIKKEKQTLESVLQQRVIASRQHYLRMNIHITPKLLLNQGIHYDFTMGFASKPGFRAGTSHPFFYYDFDNEKATDLLFIPFCIMDGVYFNYQNINIEKTLQEIQNIKSDIKKYGGYFIPLFHEITLSHLFKEDADVWRKMCVGM